MKQLFDDVKDNLHLSKKVVTRFEKFYFLVNYSQTSILRKIFNSL